MIWLILIIAFALRLIGLNQSLWLDEAISANVSALPIKDIVTNFSVNDFHPPLYYCFLNLWQNLWGKNVLFLRLSSVLFSLVTIYVVYLIGKKLQDQNTGLLAAIFLSVNPLFVYFSQELRMYAMATMWLTLALFFFLKIKDGKHNSVDLFLYNLMACLAFHTFYGSIFLLAAMAIYSFFKSDKKTFLLTNLGTLIAIISIWPLLKIQLHNSTLSLSHVTNWSLVLGKVNLKNLLLIPLKFSLGKISWYPKYSYYLIGGIWILIIAYFLSKSNPKINWLKIILILPIILATLFSFKSPLLQYFRFIYLLPIIAIILSINITPRRYKIFIGGMYLIFTLIYLFNPNFHREDWQAVAQTLHPGQNVYMIASFSDPIKFYQPEANIIDSKTQTPTEDNLLVIPYGEIIHGLNHHQILTELGYTQNNEHNFREITVSEWSR